MAQVARPVGLKALAPDCHLASGELRLPLALGDQRLLARGQPAAVGRSPARGRLRAPRRAHHDEPAAGLGVRVDTAVGLGELCLQRDDLRRDLGLGQLGHLGPPFSTAFSARSHGAGTRYYRDEENPPACRLFRLCAEEDSNLHPVIPDQALNLVTRVSDTSYASTSSRTSGNLDASDVMDALD